MGIQQQKSRNKRMDSYIYMKEYEDAVKHVFFLALKDRKDYNIKI